MTTPEKMMQHLVEQAGGCWHSHQYPKGIEYRVGSYSYHLEGYVSCACGEWSPDRIRLNLEGEEILHHKRDLYFRNPDPNDLNALMEIAEKLDVYVSLSGCAEKYNAYIGVGVKSDFSRTVGSDHATPAAALLSALYQATGGKRHEV